MNKIRIVDVQFKHGESFGTGDLKIPPTKFQWHRGDQIGDVVVVTDNAFSVVDGLKEGIKIALLLEPEEIDPNAHKWLRDNHSKFTHVLTWSPKLLNILPNARPYIFGGCWIRPEDQMIHEKPKYISMIASNKKTTQGHRLRWEVVDKLGHCFSLFGRGHNSIDYKLQGLEDYMYSVVIENDKDMLTEKLIDCFRTGTIPIYWGPELDGVFNEDGIVRFDSLEDLEDQFSKHTEDYLRTFYLQRQTAIKDNFERASQFLIPEDLIWETFLKDIV